MFHIGRKILKRPLQPPFEGVLPHRTFEQRTHPAGIGPVSYTHLDVYKRQTPERYWHYLHHLFPNNNFLVCALDIAAWDIFGKMQRKPLYKIWNIQTSTAPLTYYTIGIDSIEKMLEKMQEKPWPIYKVKVGVPGDIEMVAALRKHTDCLLYTSRCV